MAERNERKEIVVEEQNPSQGIDLGSFFASYLASMEQAKANASAQINAAYDSLIQSTGAQKEMIKKQADENFRGIYSNAKVSALNHNEQLAAMGLSRGAAQPASSGYAETSRVRQDVALQNNLNAAAMNRDNNLAAVDSRISELNAQRGLELSGLEREFSGQYLNALQQSAQMEFDYYALQQELAADQAAANREDERWQAEFDYQKQLDAWERQQWESEYAYKQQKDALSQSNWEKEYAYQQRLDAQKQANWEKEYLYQQQQAAQKQKNWLAEYLLKQGGGSKDVQTAEEEKQQVTVPQLSEAQLREMQSEERFQNYLRFAQSTASFQNDEAYASYFDQLYRQASITYEQYYRALRAREYSDYVIKLRSGLL